MDSSLRFAPLRMTMLELKVTNIKRMVTNWKHEP